MAYEVKTWNAFKGFYVMTKDKNRPNGHQFHFWAETINECEQWIQTHTKTLIGKLPAAERTVVKQGVV